MTQLFSSPTDHRGNHLQLKDNLLSENVPNEETIRVFEDTDAGKNLIHYKNANDLINKLGLK